MKTRQVKGRYDLLTSKLENEELRGRVEKKEAGVPIVLLEGSGRVNHQLRSMLTLTRGATTVLLTLEIVAPSRHLPSCPKWISSFWHA